MSYPGVDPADVQTMNPVGTQEPSAGASIDPQQLKEAVREAVSDQFKVTDGWKSRTKASVHFVVECPSGQKALLKHLDTMDLVGANIIEEMDFFTKALFPASFDDAGNPVENKPTQNFWTTLKDPMKRKRFISMLNRLLEVAVVRPKVIDDGIEIETDPETGEATIKEGSLLTVEGDVEFVTLPNGKKRAIKEGEVVTSAIDFGDKMTIFGELNKPLGMIEPFREPAVSVASVDSVEGATSSPKHSL